MASQTETLELFDLDGTLSELDVKAALEGQGGASVEIQKYFMAAAEFISGKFPELTSAEVYEGIKAKSLDVVFPNRIRYEFWAQFNSVQGNNKHICPAVDHFLIARSAIEIYLKEISDREGESGLGRKIRDFLSLNWANMVYQYSDREAAQHAVIDEDSIDVLESRLRREALAVVLTNSNPEKAINMLERAGFKGRIFAGRTARGAIGVAGSAKKWQVDETFNLVGRKFGNVINLGGSFCDPLVTLDLRRRNFHSVVSNLMSQSGASRVWMASDIPELDLLPVMNWHEFNPSVSLRVNSTSAHQSTELAVRLCGAVVGEKLSTIVGELE